MSFSVLIIGCGSIAGGFDDCVDDPIRPPKTHAKAYRENQNFELVACIDPDIAILNSFKKKWSVKQGYLDIESAIKQKLYVDVISICSPTNSHGEHLEKVLALKPKLVFCEKPIHEDYSTAKAIVKKYRDQNVQLVINYNRRFDQDLISFKNKLDGAEYGSLRAVHGWYNKGLLNNGTHLLDIVLYLFGNVNVEYVGKEYVDFDSNDPSIPVILSTNNGTVISLSCADSNDFSLFELEFIFSNARVKMLDGGLKWSVERTRDSEHFIGYKVLGPPKVADGNYIFSFENAVKNIQDCLMFSDEPTCDGEDGLRVLYLYSKIKSKVKSC